MQLVISFSEYSRIDSYYNKVEYMTRYDKKKAPEFIIWQMFYKTSPNIPLMVKSWKKIKKKKN